MPIAVKEQVEQLEKDRKKLKEYNTQFSMWAMLASALLSEVGDSEEVQIKERENKRKLFELETSKLLEELWLSISSENDWGVIFSSEGQKNMQKIKFNLTDLSRFKSFLSSLLDQADLVKSQELKTILWYIVWSLSWQVMNTYKFWEQWLDDEFLHLIWSAEDIIELSEKIWVEQWVEDLKMILLYSREQCLNEYVDIKNMWLLEQEMDWTLYPPQIQWDVPYVYFESSWSQAIDLLIKVKKNPYASKLLTNAISFRVVQMNNLERLMKDKDSVPEHVRRDFDIYKEKVIETKNSLLDLV